MGLSIIYNLNIIRDSENNNYSDDKKIIREYIVFPVLPVKVVLTYSNLPQINHFERAILSLLVNQYFDKKELSSKLCIDLDLVQLILTQLECKGLVDKQGKVTDFGFSQLKGTYSETNTEIVYVFYDLNRGCLLSTQANPNELMHVYSMNEKTIKIETDAINYNFPFSIIETNRNAPKLQDDSIDKQLRSLWKKNSNLGKTLISITPVGYEKKKYLLTALETEIGQINGSNWCVKDPFINQNDTELHDFIYEKSYDYKDINNIISQLMKQRYNRSIQINNDVLYKNIKNKLFSKIIPEKYEHFIEPLIKVLISIKESSGILSTESNRTAAHNIMRQSLLNLGDLFENILYFAAEKNKFSHTESIIKRKPYENQELLISIAEMIGFEINEQSKTLLFHSLNGLLNIIKRPHNAVIGSCIAWNLLVAEKDSSFYLHQLAKKYPYFINIMYIYKRQFRDKTRHTIDVNNKNIRGYIDILFELFDMVLNLKVNLQVLDEIIQSNDTLYDYSYSQEYLRPLIGSEIFDSTGQNQTKMKFLLVSAYEKYMMESSTYISELRSVFEDILRNLLVYLINKYDISCDFRISDYVTKASDFSKILDGFGFYTSINNDLDTSVEKALGFSDEVELRIKQGIETSFSKTNMRYKVQTLIILFKLSQAVISEFGGNELKVPSLFTTMIGIMYIDKGHQQKRYFNKEEATIIVNESINVLHQLIRNTKIKIWG